VTVPNKTAALPTAAWKFRQRAPAADKMRTTLE
jgi:hypothetical protein